MEEKRASGRSKRPAKPPEDGTWDCSVCTYKNSAEAYKCDMCDVRKGTSTRKPKINPQLVAQQVAQQFAAPLTPPPGSPTPEDEQKQLFGDPEEPFEPPQRLPLAPPAPPKPTKSSSINKGEKSSQNKQNTQTKQLKQAKKNNRPPKLKNVDRSSARQMAVTVDNVTVLITDYQPKRLKTDLSKEHTDLSDTSSNASNDIHEDRHISDNHT